MKEDRIVVPPIITKITIDFKIIVYNLLKLFRKMTQI